MVATDRAGAWGVFPRFLQQLLSSGGTVSGKQRHMGYHAMPDLSDNSRGPERERLLAFALREVIAELRLVDVADYIAFLRMEAMGNISDILESSCQLHLKAGALSFSNGGDIQVNWNRPPVVELDMRLLEAATDVHFRLIMAEGKSAVRIDHFPKLSDNETDTGQTRRLIEVLEAVRLPAGHA
ncbi:hypothetical protein FPY71_04225 [Aureimonas fodinaquatilis]|uniref:Uncharacterized protein n=1 Tax=Aureimonas fodinaquatilis TaxID=2565783 RepID=A0A5B0E2X7_9HYPH|nr:hypothetical protein [Aureimonas fodinaquatilis]KAA0972311.1 hypothetical protein FPY71_04225 [Aureimonas fodinaquatilis]